MQPTIVHLKEKILIGCSCKMNFTDNKTGELWQSFMPRLKEIRNKISADLFSVQLYNDDYNFNQFNPSAYFTNGQQQKFHALMMFPQTWKHS